MCFSTESHITRRPSPRFFRLMNPMSGISRPCRVFPDYPAPVLRDTDYGTELTTKRWRRADLRRRHRLNGVIWEGRGSRGNSRHMRSRRRLLFLPFDLERSSLRTAAVYRDNPFTVDRS